MREIPFNLFKRNLGFEVREMFPVFLSLILAEEYPG